MVRYQSFLKPLVVLTFVLSLSTTAFAQATRTWVSGVGDDANPCSRTAPCKTWVGAITKTATAGEVSALDPGGFGPISITKSITLSGDGTLASILSAGGNGIVVNTTGNVILRHISINGAGSGTRGINVIAAGSLDIDSCTISGHTVAGIYIGTSVTPKVNIMNTRIYANTAAGANGITALPTAQGVNLTINNCTITDNNNDGVYIGQNTYGVIKNSLISANGRGVHVEQNVAAGTRAFLEDSTLSHNGTGLRLGVGAVNCTISRMNIEGNNVGLDQTSGTLFSYGGNYISGNNSANTATTSPVTPQ